MVKYSWRAVSLMAMFTFLLAFATVNMYEYWGMEIQTIFFVLTTISGIRTVHMGARVR